MGKYQKYFISYVESSNFTSSTRGTADILTDSIQYVWCSHQKSECPRYTHTPESDLNMRMKKYTYCVS